MKKALIITQPIGLNYGGILQAYALQKYVQSYIKNVETLTWKTTCSFRKKLGYTIKQILFRILKIKKQSDCLLLTNKDYKKLTSNTQKFIKKHIKMTETAYSSKDNLCLKQELGNYDVYIAGSDQCWACKQPSQYVLSCMFDFISNCHNKTRISYAASFGSDEFCGEEKFCKNCKELLLKFNAISVREESAVKILKRYFDLPATQVIDPTMLLEIADYKNLIFQNDITEIKNSLFAYILDYSKEKNEIIEKVLKATNLKKSEIILSNQSKAKLTESYNALPSVEQWLYNIIHSEFIITDSYHGCVFAILFNKHFIAIANNKRGAARFNSLLKLFNLENQLINNSTEITTDLIEKQIDFDYVNMVIKKERLKAKCFFENFFSTQP